MVQAQHPAHREMARERGAEVPVGVPARTLGMWWPEPPVLALVEEPIRRGAGRGAAGEGARVARDVVAVGMGADREIEVQRLASCAHRRREPVQLLVGEELRVPVVALAPGVDRMVRDRGRGAGATRLHGGTEPCVVVDLRPPRLEPAERVGARRVEPVRSLLDDPSAGGHDHPVVEVRLDRRRRQLQPGELRHGGEVEEELVPPPTTDRRVGAGVVRLVEERREQRQRAHHLRTVAGRPCRQPAEAAQVRRAGRRRAGRRPGRRRPMPARRVAPDGSADGALRTVASAPSSAPPRTTTVCAPTGSETGRTSSTSSPRRLAARAVVDRHRHDGAVLLTDLDPAPSRSGRVPVAAMHRSRGAAPSHATVTGSTGGAGSVVRLQRVHDAGQHVVVEMPDACRRRRGGSS